MNYWSYEKMIDRLKPTFSEAVVSQIMHYRVKCGGIFWTDKELKEALNLVQSQVGLESPALTQYIYDRIDLDHDVLSFITPQIIPSCSITPHIDGPDALQEIVTHINHAQHFIHFSVMLFFHDEAGKTVGPALVAAARRGVTVRLMIDKSTTRTDILWGLLEHTISNRGDFNILAKEFQKVGIHICRTDPEVYNHISWRESIRHKRAEKGVPELFLKLQDLPEKSQEESGIDTVYHRKFMVVDNQISWVGSVNVGHEYLYHEALRHIPGNSHGVPPLKKWHDGLVSIKGAEFARRLNRIFLQQWTILGGDVYNTDSVVGQHVVDEKPEGNDQIAILFNFPGNPVSLCHSLYRSVIRFADKGVLIENPYIISESFWKVLGDLPPEQAQKIRIISCLKINDHVFVPPNFKVNALKPHTNGVQFFDFSECGAFSHWKVFTAEDTHTVFHGSTNLNTRSEIHDFELDVLVKSPTLYKQVTDLLKGDIRSGKPVDPKAYVGNEADKIVNELTEYFS